MRATAAAIGTRTDLEGHTWKNPVIEVWERPGSARRDGQRRRATIEAYTRDGGLTYVVRDGRPYGHASGSDRCLLADTVEGARKNFARVRRILKSEGYVKVALAI